MTARCRAKSRRGSFYRSGSAITSPASDTVASLAPALIGRVGVRGLLLEEAPDTAETEPATPDEHAEMAAALTGSVETALRNLNAA